MISLIELLMHTQPVFMSNPSSTLWKNMKAQNGKHTKVIK